MLTVFGNTFHYLNNKPWQPRLTRGNARKWAIRATFFRPSGIRSPQNWEIAKFCRVAGLWAFPLVKLYFEEEPQIFCGPKLLSSFLMTTKPEWKSIYVCSIYFKGYGTVIQNMTKFLNSPNESPHIIYKLNEKIRKKNNPSNFNHYPAPKKNIEISYYFLPKVSFSGEIMVKIILPTPIDSLFRAYAYNIDLYSPAGMRDFNAFTLTVRFLTFTSWNNLKLVDK